MAQESSWWETWVWWVHPLGFGLPFALSTIIMIVGMEVWPEAESGFIAFGAGFLGYRVSARRRSQSQCE